MWLQKKRKNKKTLVHLAEIFPHVENETRRERPPCIVILAPIKIKREERKKKKLAYVYANAVLFSSLLALMLVAEEGWCRDCGRCVVWSLCRRTWPCERDMTSITYIYHFKSLKKSQKPLKEQVLMVPSQICNGPIKATESSLHPFPSHNLL
jgi:hypothetical protein